MELTLPPQLDTGTALRYLGAAGWTPDDGTARLLAGAESALRAAATPRGVWRRLPLSALPLAGAGRDLARHLQGCTGLVLMAATLGSGADAALRRLCLQDVALGAVADAVASVLLGGVTLTGSQVRSLFGLRSPSFTVTWDGADFVFSVTGYGHGVGMSQYGANAMAKEGGTFRDILTWYYTGAQVGELW